MLSQLRQPLRKPLSRLIFAPSRNMVVINPATNGPLIVKDFDYIDSRFVATPGNNVAICRCGRSRNKPLCDGSHQRVSPPWSSANDPAQNPQPDRLDVYERSDKTLTIFDNRGLCAHAGHCTDNLMNRVFHAREPWIDADGLDDVEEIKRVIRMCPSGALSYAEGPSDSAPQVTDFAQDSAIEPEPNMFYRVRGGVQITGAHKMQGQGTEHAALCRCGGSSNKPYCTGAHWNCQFRDDGWRRLCMLGELGDAREKTVQLGGVEFVVRAVPGEKRATVTAGGQELEVRMDPKWDQVVVNPAEIREKLGAAADLGGPPGAPDMEDLLAPSKPAAKRSKHSGAAAAADESTDVEPTLAYIKQLAREGLTSHHGPMTAMGVPRGTLPHWDDIQFVTAQLSCRPLLDDAPVSTELVIGAHCRRPLRLDLPVFVSDMSFGALSRNAKVALARGAEMAGTGICSGEGGSLDAERAENSRYFYEIASAMFGYKDELLQDRHVSAVHFKGGQAAKTGTGGHLSAVKVTPEIARVRDLQPGQDAISPATFVNLETAADFKAFGDHTRELTGGAPVGFKLSAQHIEEDLQFALDAGADYVILDGRGGATGAAPVIFRDHISVPTLPALARARRFLDRAGAKHVTLIVTGGLRTSADFAKALCLGANGVAIANSAMQAIGCVAARVCNTNTCPSGVATQDEALGSLINVDKSAVQLRNFLDASRQLLQVLARACGHSSTADFCVGDITTWKRDVAYLTGIRYGGVVSL